MKPTVIVELIKQAGVRRFPGRKPQQPWRWIVRDAGNNEPFERPTERYSEERGALDAIEQVHGPDATVILRRPGQPDQMLRSPASAPTAPVQHLELTDRQCRIVQARLTELDGLSRAGIELVVDAINYALADKPGGAA